MLYNCENPVLRIVGVEHLGWNGGYFEVAARDYSALAFRISGTAVIGNSQNKYPVHSNDILYLPQNMEYTADYTDTEMIVIHFVTAMPDREVEVYELNNSEEVYKLFLQAHALWKSKEPGCAVFVMSLLYKILGTIWKNETNQNLPTHFLKAVSDINGHYKSGDLSVKSICEKAGIGETAFRQLFKKVYAKTPVEYITDLRLEYARNLIAGNMSVENAALESGFSDPKYFARVVKKRLGCTPRELRLYGK